MEALKFATPLDLNEADCCTKIQIGCTKIQIGCNKIHQNTNSCYPQISRTHPAGRLENLAGDGGATVRIFGLSNKILQNIHLDYLFSITGELVLRRFAGKCFHVFRLFCCLGFISVLDKD